MSEILWNIGFSLLAEVRYLPAAICSLLPSREELTPQLINESKTTTNLAEFLFLHGHSSALP